MAGFYVVGIALLLGLIVFMLKGEPEKPTPPVKFLGDDGFYHYLPGQDPAERDDPNRWNFDHNS